jgi:hypothetical protein
MFVLPGEQAGQECTSCREKPADCCKAPGCGISLRSARERELHFCNRHMSEAYACSWRRCPYRADAGSPVRCCPAHEPRAMKMAEQRGSPFVPRKVEVARGF